MHSSVFSEHQLIYSSLCSCLELTWRTLQNISEESNKKFMRKVSSCGGQIGKDP